MIYGKDIGKKFDKDGNVLHYPGNTVVADIVPGCSAYDVMSHLRQMVIEAGFEDIVDAVVMVYAPEALRIERAMKRDHAKEAQIRARIAAQMNDEEKCKRADYIIYTDGSISLESQLSTLITQLKLENK